MSDAMGRPVTVVSLSFDALPLDQVVTLIEAEAGHGCDLLALPESWHGQGEGTQETLAGPTITLMSELARRHGCYIVCPFDRTTGDRRYNTAVLLDRGGHIAGLYDKMYPYWSELGLTPTVVPGASAPVFQTDFGKVGMAICFDANFPLMWEQLAEGGAELVIWSSAYSAGTTLQAHALQHHYYIVTSTCTCDCLVYDITGQELHDQHHPGYNVSRVTLDLDRAIYHENFNEAPCQRLLAEHGEQVEIEQRLEREQWFVLRSRVAGASARELAHSYGLEELRAYKKRSRIAIDQLREQANKQGL